MQNTLSKKEEAVILDKLIGDKKGPAGFKDVFSQLSKAVMERMFDGEMDHHLNREKHEQTVDGNYRNGTSSKSVRTEHGEINLDIPRDRNSTFEPALIPKHQRQIDGFDEFVINLYARGFSTRDIKGFIAEQYNYDVSHELISNITDKILPDLNAWRNRSLDSHYVVIYLDALVVKAKDASMIKNKSLYLAIGITLEGKKEVLGMWLQETEGARFWLSVLTNLKNRGVQDVFIFCVDGLKGFPEAIESAFPKSDVQLCIVHIIRNCMKFIAWKDMKKVLADLKLIYTSPNAESAEMALIEFQEKYGSKYQPIVDIWQNNWSNIATFFQYPADIRKVIYTTNIIESANRQIRKVIKTKSSFPNDMAVYKIVFLCLQNVTKK